MTEYLAHDYNFPYLRSESIAVTVCSFLYTEGLDYGHVVYCYGVEICPYFLSLR